MTRPDARTAALERCAPLIEEWNGGRGYLEYRRHCEAGDALCRHINVLARMLRDADAFLATVCDQPEDRMYHAADQTWWRREGLSWKAADPPNSSNSSNSSPASALLQGIVDRLRFEANSPGGVAARIDACIGTPAPAPVSAETPEKAAPISDEDEALLAKALDVCRNECSIDGALFMDVVVTRLRRALADLKRVTGERDAARALVEAATRKGVIAEAMRERDDARAILARVREVAEEHTDNPCAEAVLDAMDAPPEAGDERKP